MLKHYTIPIFIPELACPHQCVFCDQKKISGQQEIPNIKEVQNKIKKYLETIPRNICYVYVRIRFQYFFY